jgi:mannose-6-phosphate isomerase-like protein (cupin superfamily)
MDQVQKYPSGSFLFEGGQHGASTSFFMVRNAPGDPGPPLHYHPYSETWLVLKGRAQFTAGEYSAEAGPGEILVTEPETPHKFHNSGTEVLEMVCIHAAPKLIQHDLE